MKQHFNSSSDQVAYRLFTLFLFFFLVPKIFALSAGTFLEPTVWLRTWKQGPASLTTTTSALWKCHLEDTKIQVGCF